MSTTTVTGRAIIAGYEWRMRVKASAVLFPDASTYIAHVRPLGDAATLLATLTTAGGGVTRLDGRTIELLITGATSTAWRDAAVVMDVVRTDSDPDLHMGFFLTVPVVQPVTVL